MFNFIVGLIVFAYAVMSGPLVYENTLIYLLNLVVAFAGGRMTAQGISEVLIRK